VFQTVLLPYHQANRIVSVMEKRACVAGCRRHVGGTHGGRQVPCSCGAVPWKLLWKGSHSPAALPGPKRALLWEPKFPPSPWCTAALSYLCSWCHRWASRGSKVGWDRKRVRAKSNHLRRCERILTRDVSLAPSDSRIFSLNSEDGQSNEGRG